jgi:hypothetical protein
MCTRALRLKAVPRHEERLGMMSPKRCVWRKTSTRAPRILSAGRTCFATAGKARSAARWLERDPSDRAAGCARDTCPRHQVGRARAPVSNRGGRPRGRPSPTQRRLPRARQSGARSCRARTHSPTPRQRLSGSRQRGGPVEARSSDSVKACLRIGLDPDVEAHEVFTLAPPRLPSGCNRNTH